MNIDGQKVIELIDAAHEEAAKTRDRVASEPIKNAVVMAEACGARRALAELRGKVMNLIYDEAKRA